MAQRNARSSGLDDWEKICFSDIEIAGVKGPCELPDCIDTNKGCKLRMLIEKGILPESAPRKSNIFIQHTCGYEDVPLFDNTDNMNDFVDEVRRKYPTKRHWNKG